MRLGVAVLWLEFVIYYRLILFRSLETCQGLIFLAKKSFSIKYNNRNLNTINLRSGILKK